MVEKIININLRNQQLRAWRKKRSDQAEALLGKKCYFCPREKNLVYHEKQGRKHLHYHTASLVLKNPNSFVRLCHPCHRAVHCLVLEFNC